MPSAVPKGNLISARIAATIARTLPQGLRVNRLYPDTKARAAAHTVATTINGHRLPIHVGLKGPCQRPPNTHPSSPKLWGAKVRRKRAPIRPLTTRSPPKTHHRSPNVCRCRCTRDTYMGIGGCGYPAYIGCAGVTCAPHFEQK